MRRIAELSCYPDAIFTQAGGLETGDTGSVNEDIDRTGAVLDTWLMDWILL